MVDRITLELAVARLADGYREVFVMHDALGYEHHEIAEGSATQSVIPNRSSTKPAYAFARCYNYHHACLPTRPEVQSPMTASLKLTMNAKFANNSNRPRRNGDT